MAVILTTIRCNRENCGGNIIFGDDEERAYCLLCRRIYRDGGSTRRLIKIPQLESMRKEPVTKRG